MQRTYQATITLEAAVTKIRGCLEKADVIINQLEVTAHSPDNNELQQQLLEQLRQLYQEASASLAEYMAAEMKPKKTVDLPPFLKGGR